MIVLTILQFIINIILVGALFAIIITALVLLFKDKRQKQHSVLRNYPVLARVRYFLKRLVRVASVFVF